jgi:hypothetical protein
VKNAHVGDSGKAPACGDDGSQIAVRGTAKVTLDAVVVQGGPALGAFIADEGSLSASYTSFWRHPQYVVKATGGQVTLRGGTIDTDSQGVAVSVTNTDLDLESMVIQNNKTAVDLKGSSSLRMRNTQIVNASFGISSAGTGQVRMDLGTTADPGKNSISSMDRALIHLGTFAAPVTFDAVGNVWNIAPGTDTSGRYPSVAFEGLVNDRNFYVVAPISLQL